MPLIPDMAACLFAPRLPRRHQRWGCADAPNSDSAQNPTWIATILWIAVMSNHCRCHADASPPRIRG